MKTATLVILAITSLAQAYARKPVRVVSPMVVTCEKSDGTKTVTGVRVLVYDSQEKDLVGIGFGPNRQDDGLKSFEGNCIIEARAESRSSRNE